MVWPFKKPSTALQLQSPAPRAKFAYSPTFGNFLAYVASQSVTGPVTKLEALSVPAMLRGRNLICSIATLPLELFDKNNMPVQNALFDQFDPDIPNVVHLAQTIEDLVLDGVSWWRITAFGWDGYPVNVRRIDPVFISVHYPTDRTPAPLPSGLDPRDQVVWVSGEPVPTSEIIRFDSPNPGLLLHGAQALRRAIMFDRAAKMYAENPDAAEIIRIPDDYDDDRARLFADNYLAAKRSRSTVNLPVDVSLEKLQGANPAQIQLVEMQRQASIEIANLLGLDPEELGVSTTSRTYSNVNDRRRDKINDVLSPYMRAITDRLSMPDVTKRGQVCRFDLSDYLKANDMERWNNYKTAAELGVLSSQEIRDAEKIGGQVPANPTPPTQATEKVDPGTAPVEEPTVDPSAGAADSAAASAIPEHRFSTPKVTFVDLPLETFSVDSETRTITGVTLPYGKTAHGMRFEKGALKFQSLSHVKLLRDHDPLQPIGVATSFNDSTQGVTMSFKVARGAAGDAALAMAEDHVLDGLSVGVDFTQDDIMPDPRYKNSILIRRADLREVSLTAMPAFSDARVVTVKASDAQMATGDSTSTKEDAVTAPTGPVPFAAEGLITINPQSEADEPEDQDGQDGKMMAAASDKPAVTFTRPTVNPVRPVATTSVREALPYRFDRAGRFAPVDRGEHVFSADLHHMAQINDIDGTRSEAGKRVFGLIRAQFDTQSTDVSALNPTMPRPDLWVPQMPYRYPIWSSIDRGAPPNGIQPFLFPKFSAASSLSGNHTQGTEPTAGVFQTTSQTVTPTAISGKAQITREVWDMGGNPAVSTLIWDQMVRSWNEGLESAAATFLNTLAGSATVINLNTGATAGQPPTSAQLQANWEGAIAGLQFVRGYDFSTCVMEQNAYLAFAAAVDTTGRKIYPMFNPMNSDGQAQPRFSQINAAGITLNPAWALPQTPGSPNNSWLYDPSKVWGWASAPQRLEFPGSGAANIYTPVAHVDLAIWGYKALANVDIAGVRQITYDTTT